MCILLYSTGSTIAIVRFAIWPDKQKTQSLNHAIKTCRTVKKKKASLGSIEIRSVSSPCELFTQGKELVVNFLPVAPHLTLSSQQLVQPAKVRLESLRTRLRSDMIDQKKAKKVAREY